MSNLMNPDKRAAADRLTAAEPIATSLLTVGALLIAGVALLAYLPSLRGGFLLDDDYLVTRNSLINASDGLYRFWFTTEPMDYWPLTNSSFWIEWRMWGTNPTGYHVTNLVLHIASALLVWAILSKLSIPGAWLAALLFAVHPVNVESVAWISQRKNTLSMLFFLVSILWYLKADRDVGRWYWSSLLAFTLAMLSKGSVAILPVVLLLLAWWQRGSISRRDLARTAPFFVVAVVLTIVNIWFQKHGSTDSIRDVTFVQRLLGAGAVVWFYLYKALLPLNLIFIYPQWNIQAGDWRWWAPLAATIGVTALLFWQRNTRFGRPLLFAWLFFCVALLPVMGFTDVGFMRFALVADHYQHIAIIAIVTLVAAGASLLYERLQRSFRSAAIALAIVVTVALTFLTWKQSRLYVDALTLYETTVADNPDSYFAHYNLAITLGERGRLSDAIDHLRDAVRLDSEYFEAFSNLGQALSDTGNPEEAIEYFEQARRLNPRSVEVRNNLAIALKRTGRPDQAIEQFQEALRLKPDYALAHLNLAGIYAEMKRYEEAVDSGQKGLYLARSAGQIKLARQFERLLAAWRAKLVPPDPVPPVSSGKQ